MTTDKLLKHFHKTLQFKYSVNAYRDTNHKHYLWALRNIVPKTFITNLINLMKCQNIILCPQRLSSLLVINHDFINRKIYCFISILSETLEFYLIVKFVHTPISVD